MAGVFLRSHPAPRRPGAAARLSSGPPRRPPRAPGLSLRRTCHRAGPGRRTSLPRRVTTPSCGAPFPPHRCPSPSPPPRSRRCRCPHRRRPVPPWRRRSPPLPSAPRAPPAAVPPLSVPRGPSQGRRRQPSWGGRSPAASGRPSGGEGERERGAGPRQALLPEDG